jgi:hypothetical protein
MSTPIQTPDATAGTSQVPASTVQPTSSQAAPAAQQPAQQQQPEPTVPMIAPDGTIADIPQSRRVDATLKGGYKLGINMIGKDGREAVIPSENAQEAIDKGGYRLKDPNQPLYEKAMQQSMGGPPQFVDVPVGTKELFEKAGQEGYTKGGELGLATVAGGGALAAVAQYIPEIETVYKIAKILGATGFGFHEIMQGVKLLKGK